MSKNMSDKEKESSLPINRISKPKDTTGLCTIRGLAAAMLECGPIFGEYVGEMAFDLDGKQINMEFAITFVDGVPHARQWKPALKYRHIKQVAMAGFCGGIGAAIALYLADKF